MTTQCRPPQLVWLTCHITRQKCMCKCKCKYVSNLFLCLLILLLPISFNGILDLLHDNMVSAAAPCLVNLPPHPTGN